MAKILVTIVYDDKPDHASELASFDGSEQDAYYCNDCDILSESCESEKLYECGECGTKFPQSEGVGRNGNMCPQCRNKFGAKIADEFCTECRECEVEKRDAIVCECGEVIDASEWADHIAREHIGTNGL